MIRSARTGSLLRGLVVLVVAASAAGALHALDREQATADGGERLYFPSGEFLVESSLGFREVMADWLWFRFIQYYGDYKAGRNDMRYLDLAGDTRFRSAYARGLLFPAGSEASAP